MVIVVMGVAGAGKTTVGRLLAEELGWRFHDADAYHPEENVEKMEGGEGLTDADRQAWLQALRELIEQLRQKEQSAVLACSALKRAYRRQLQPGGIEVRFVYLKAEPDLIQQRLEERTDHFAGTDLLESQFAVLEEPEDALVVSAHWKPRRIVDRIIEELRKREE